MPDAMAMAFTVRLDGTEIGPVYCGELVVGVDPSTVYRMVAPAVLLAMVTVWAVG
jgi:hypothetical protein